MAENSSSAFINDSNVIDKTIHPIPAPEKEIGIDTKEYLFQNIINASAASSLNMAQIESFTSATRSREQMYQMIDSMSEDSKVSSVLETYAEDATEYNDEGRIVWVESSNPNIAAYINFLLKTLRVDKNIYTWAHCLCKYGDLYLRLFRKSEYTDLIFDSPKNEPLNEDIKLNAYASNDRYVNYVEMVPNPAEMFELTRFGKTAGYIQAPAAISTVKQQAQNIAGNFQRYKFNKNDINIYSATEFVHACLEDNSNRVPEQVDIFIDNDSETDSQFTSYKVRRGQSLLYNSFKVWRELMLLENSILLNRITKSSIVRVVGVEVGDMPKEMVGPHLQGIKQMFEQKMSINSGSSMGEYTNPGPYENTIYVPIHNEKGTIKVESIGGDVNIKDIADIDYYTNLFYGGLRVPKQYFSQTDDNTGFNGGTSLTIISSRYAKAIKRIQNTLVQAITDMLNLMLIDAGLSNYINHFQIHMLPPTTQEEKDRQDNTSSRVQLVTDVMNLLGDIDDQPTKLRVLNSLLSSVLTNPEVSLIIQNEIGRLEAEKTADEEVTLEDDAGDSAVVDSVSTTSFDETEPMNFSSQESSMTSSEPVISTTSSVETTSQKLPNPSELGVDMTEMP